MDKRITDYHPLTRNPNKGTQRGTGILDQSVRELGAGRSLLVDKNGVILAGNHAQEAFVNAGLENVIEVETDGNQIVVVKRTDMDANSTAGKKMAIMDNRTSEQGLAWDALVLEEMLNEIKQDEGELDAALEKLAGELDINMGELQDAPEPEIDKAEELRVKWGVESGQLWQLGEHRLICGDSTNIELYKKLFIDEKSTMIWTDPPYGVSYGDKLEAANPMGYRVRTIENDNLKPEELEKFIRSVFKNCSEFTIAGAAIYAASPAGTPLPRLIASFNDSGFEFRWGLVWVKDQIVLSRADYHFQHENILYGWKPDGAHKWSGDRKQSSCMFVDRPKKSEEHPTMKPVELVEIMIKNNSDNNDIVLDPFLGSGTTLIACENLNRKCRAVEISPAYVAVALERWHQHTGLMPELIESK